MRLSLTTTGLLDPRQLAAWSSERRRAIHQAVAKGMQSGGREVRDAARAEMRTAFAIKRASFASSMGVKVFEARSFLAESDINPLGVTLQEQQLTSCSSGE